MFFTWKYRVSIWKHLSGFLSIRGFLILSCYGGEGVRSCLGALQFHCSHFSGAPPFCPTGWLSSARLVRTLDLVHQLNLAHSLARARLWFSHMGFGNLVIGEVVAMLIATASPPQIFRSMQRPRGQMTVPWAEGWAPHLSFIQWTAIPPLLPALNTFNMPFP